MRRSRQRNAEISEEMSEKYSSVDENYPATRQRAGGRTTGAARSADVVAVRVADRGRAVPRPGLGEDPADVGLDGVVAQEQLRSDLRVGHPAGDHAQDLRLALGQAVGAPCGLGLGGCGRGGE